MSRGRTRKNKNSRRKHAPKKNTGIKPSKIQSESDSASHAFFPELSMRGFLSAAKNFAEAIGPKSEEFFPNQQNRSETPLLPKPSLTDMLAFPRGPSSAWALIKNFISDIGPQADEFLPQPQQTLQSIETPEPPLKAEPQVKAAPINAQPTKVQPVKVQLPKPLLPNTDRLEKLLLGKEGEKIDLIFAIELYRQIPFESPIDKMYFLLQTKPELFYLSSGDEKTSDWHTAHCNFLKAFSSSIVPDETKAKALHNIDHIRKEATESSPKRINLIAHLEKNLAQLDESVRPYALIALLKSLSYTQHKFGECPELTESYFKRLLGSYHGSLSTKLFEAYQALKPQCHLVPAEACLSLNRSEPLDDFILSHQGGSIRVYHELSNYLKKERAQNILPFLKNLLSKNPLAIIYDPYPSSKGASVGRSYDLIQLLFNKHGFNDPAVNDHLNALQQKMLLSFHENSRVPILWRKETHKTDPIYKAVKEELRTKQNKVSIKPH